MDVTAETVAPACVCVRSESDGNPRWLLPMSKKSGLHDITCNSDAQGGGYDGGGSHQTQFEEEGGEEREWGRSR